MASNGVVHVIDDVLTFPPPVNQVFAPNSSLGQFVQLAGLSNELNVTSNITLFAPTDNAFAQLSQALRTYLSLPQARSDLQSVLLYHVASANILYAGTIPTGTTTYPTLDGTSTLSVTKDANGSITVNNVATVVQANLLAENGVVHDVSSVLVPPGFTFNLQRALVGLNATALLAAINLVGLDNLLNGTTNYTIFAPTNAALAGLNVTVTELAKILSYHVAPGYIPTTALTNGELLSSLLVEPTLQGQAQMLKIATQSGVSVNGVNVTIPNNLATNGVVHVIDALLMPPGDILSVVSATPALSTLTQLASAVDTTLRQANLTVFAPTNAAFTALGQALLTYLQLNTSRATLVSVLNYHIAPNAVVYSANFPTTPTPLPTVNGADVTVARNGTTVTVNGALVVVPDELASNGVVHQLNAVLLPPGFSFTLRQALLALDATVLVNLINKVGLSNLINGTGNFTVFAPTNAALNALPGNITDAQLTALLQYHFVSGILPSTALSDGQLLASLSNLASLGGRPQQLKVGQPTTGFSVNGVNVTSANNLASDGVIHVVNQVLAFPGTIPEVVSATPTLSQLSQLVTAGSFSGSLSAHNLTLFAPNNAAFEAIGPALVNYLLLPAALADLQSVLSYHAVVDPTIYYTPDIPVGTTTLTTLNGNTLAVSKTAAGTVTISPNVSLVVPNVLGANGVAHEISEVLLPPNFVFNLQRALTGVNATLLISLIQRAGLADFLNSSTAYTIFAPTNAALASLPSNTTDEQLADILRYHFVQGVVRTTDMVSGQLLSSLLVLPTIDNQGQKLKVTLGVGPNGVQINQANIVIPNNMATNGVVQVIDQLLVAPPDIGTVARNIPSVSTLTRLVQLVGHHSNITQPNMTALAPSNNAFNALGSAVLGYLLLNTTASELALENVLAYHILPRDVLYTTALPAGSTMVWAILPNLFFLGT